MPDFAALKERQQQMWAAGDFSMIGVGQVLDVATGSGNTALAAARRHCDVIGVDYVPTLLERGRERAAAERLPVTFREGDTEHLPFPDGAFDVVLSTFGVMFAPNQAQAARELLRVCRPGGKIGLANWTPDGFTGQGSRITAEYIPPPPGLSPPRRWGTEEGLRALFGTGGHSAPLHAPQSHPPLPLRPALSRALSDVFWSHDTHVRRAARRGAGAPQSCHAGAHPSLQSIG